MNEKEIVKTIMRTKNCSQARLAKEMGYKGQTNVTGLLNNVGKGMRTDSLLKALDVLGYELVIRDKFNPKTEYIVGGKEEYVHFKRMTKDEEIAYLKEKLAQYEGESV